MQERIYTIAEVAQQLQVSTKTVRHWIAGGQITAIRIGREWRVRESALQDFLIARTSQARR